MERISKSLSRVLQPSEAVSLAKPSGKRVSAEDGLNLMKLMAQAQAALPNQTLTPMTVDVYMRAWEELTVQYGMELFVESLWKVISDADFFPNIRAVKEACRAGYGQIHRYDTMKEIEARNAEAEADRLAHPENYTHVRDVWAEAIRKMDEKSSQTLN
jgi:hypothetical protein